MGERTIQIMILEKQAMSVAAGTSRGERFCFVLSDRNDYREKGSFWSDVLDRYRRDGLICINTIIVRS